MGNVENNPNELSEADELFYIGTRLGQVNQTIRNLEQEKTELEPRYTELMERIGPLPQDYEPPSEPPSDWEISRF